MVFSISSIPPVFAGQHSKRREFCLLIFHMTRDLPAISWSPQFGCFTMEDPCKKSSSNESRKIFSSIPLGDTHHKTSIMASRHSCSIGSMWFQSQVSLLTVTLSFRFSFCSETHPFAKKKEQGKKADVNHYNCTRFYLLPNFFVPPAANYI